MKPTLLFALALVSAASHAQWTVTNLHPAEAVWSMAFGAGGNQQVGVAQYSQGGVAINRAALWTGTAASAVSVSPSFVDAAYAQGVSGGLQVGNMQYQGVSRPVVWGFSNFTAGVELSGYSDGWAYGVSGLEIVGSTVMENLGGVPHATRWILPTDPLHDPITLIDLNPAWAEGSEAFGVDGGQQVGWAAANGGGYAMLWTGTADSGVNLNPAGSIDAHANAVSDGHQVGYATVDHLTRASLWNGTAASWVDLNPAGSGGSVANGVLGGHQVGYAVAGGPSHAGLWSGTAASWVDLHALLPADFTDSFATAISTDGVNEYIAGWGVSVSIHPYQALLWSRPVPEPATMTILGLGAVALIRRRRRVDPPVLLLNPSGPLLCGYPLMG